MADEEKDKQADEEQAALEAGEPTMEIKPVEKKPSAKIENDRDATNLEDDYPDITEQIRRFAEAVLPSCPHCGSSNTASVQVGMIGRALTIAESTPKVKLVPSAKDKLGIYFCNECGKFFS